VIDQGRRMLLHDPVKGIEYPSKISIQLARAALAAQGLRIVREVGK